MSEERHDELQFAPDEVPRRLLIRVALATVVISLLLCVVAYVLLRARESQLRPSHEWPEARLGAPGEAAAIRPDVFERDRPRPSLVEAQRKRLQSYQWIDRAHQVARIPIDQAIDSVVEQNRKGAQ